jgi:hypothetical protein
MRGEVLECRFNTENYHVLQADEELQRYGEAGWERNKDGLAGAN